MSPHKLSSSAYWLEQVNSTAPNGSVVAPKKPVGGQPICSEQQIRRIDPIWCFGRVPRFFWSEKANRRNYLLWLGHRLGFRRMRDWYRLTYQSMADHGGACVANRHWHGSPIHAVKECFPDYEWQEWFFVQVPRAFFDDMKNLRRYMAWLGKQLHVRRPEDWYRVTTANFMTHCGGGILLKHRSSVSAHVMACYPEYDWKPWLFERAPSGLWKNRKCCRQYLKWLGRRLGYTRLDDWYRITYSDLQKNHGLHLVKLHRSSAAAVVVDLIPRRQWCEWKFTRVPPGFWDRPENRLRYVKWLGDQLGCRRMDDWLRVRWADFTEHCGGSLLGRYGSHWSLLKECFPQGEWPTGGR